MARGKSITTQSINFPIMIITASTGNNEINYVISLGIRWFILYITVAIFG